MGKKRSSKNGWKERSKSSPSQHRADETLDNTIVFTEDELKRLRDPNLPPLDGDYFIETEAEKPKKSENHATKAHELAEEDLEFSEIPALEASLEENETTKQEELLLDEGIDESIDLSEEQLVNDEVEEEKNNPFSYKPIAKKLRSELDEDQTAEPANLIQKLLAIFDPRHLNSKQVKQSLQAEKDSDRLPTPEFEEWEQAAESIEEQPVNEVIEAEDYEVNGLDTTDAPDQTSSDSTQEHINQHIDLTDESAIDQYSEKLSQETQHFSEPILTDQVLEEVLGHDDLTVEDEVHDQANSFVKGAAWLTAGSVFSRILGALYIIPWSAWLGAEYMQANTLYSVGYKPYALFLAIATAGFPSAIAKQMAYYHSKKEYKVADKLFKYSLSIMLATGLISGALLFVLAPVLAAQSATDNPLGATLVIRSLVPALLILPLMSLFRGYFQGFNDMVPSAVSQILEQIARVFYLLAATYAIMQMYQGEVTNAVVHSTFAAFIGALASMLYLVIVYLRRLPLINKLKERSLDIIQIDFKESIKIMVLDSIPFILLGSGIIIAQIIDTYTFKQILMGTSVLLVSEISELYGAMSLDVDKLAMIIISLAVALASSVVPLITSKFASRDLAGTSRLVEQIVLVFSFVMLPAAVGMASVANNLYHLFYPQGHVSGPSLLVTASFMSIILGAYTILSTILQSMNFRRLSVRFLLIGILVKIVLQFPFVGLFHAHGALWSTTIAFTVSSVLMWIKIAREVKLDYSKIVGILARIGVATFLMGLITSSWNSLFDLLIGEVGRGLTFVKVMLVVVIGLFVYATLMGMFGLLNILIGDKYKGLQDKLRVFK